MILVRVGTRVKDADIAEREWRAVAAITIAAVFLVAGCSGSAANSAATPASSANAVTPDTDNAADTHPAPGHTRHPSTTGHGPPAPRPPATPRYTLSPLPVIRRAYRHTAGVELTTATRASAITASPRFLLQLHGDTVIGEEFVDPRPGGETLVTHLGIPTYMRAPHQSCWRRLARSDARNLVNVPGPFPENGKVRSLPPSHHAWRAIIETRSEFWFLPSRVRESPRIKNKSFLSLTINPRTHMIETITIRKPDPAVRARLHVRTLPYSPAFPTPTPLCTSP